MTASLPQRKSVCFLRAACIVLAAGSLLMSSSVARAQPATRVLQKVTLDPHIGTTVPLDDPFRNHRDQPATLRTALGGKPAVLCLVYIDCPMLCRLAADGLVRSLADVKQTVGDEFHVVIVSMDPRDTPQKAAESRRELIRRYGRPETGDGWKFLTGKEPAISKLTRSLGYGYLWDEATQQYAHPAGVFLLSPEGMLTSCLAGVEFPADRLTAAIESAGQGELAQVPASEQAPSFLTCYIYDPTTGRFGAAVQWTVRVLGLATVIALGLGIAMMLRKQPAAPSQQ